MPLLPAWLAGRRPRVRGASEAKASAARRLVALTTSGRPQWTPRDYAALAREGYAANPVVHRCVRLIAEACASMRFVVTDGGARAPDHALQRLLDRPNPEESGPDLLERFFGALQTAGNAYLEAAGEAGSAPTELYALRPDRVRVVPGPDGWPQGWIYTADGREALLAREADGFAPVLHLKLYNPLDDHYGLSPLEAAARAVDVHNASSAWNKALLDNAARPSGALGLWRRRADERGAVRAAEGGAFRASHRRLGGRAAAASGGRARLEAHGADARRDGLRRGQARRGA